MLSRIKMGDYTVCGASLGGLYTGLHIPEMDSLFDVGIALRTGAGASRLFLSHAHLDHLGALPALLGIRGMIGAGDRPLDVYCPRGVEGALVSALNELSQLHRWPLRINPIPLEAGDERCLHRDLWVKALVTYHPVPSLGYLLFNRVAKLKPEYSSLSGPEIAQLKRDKVEITHWLDRPKVAYLTDTLPEALKRSPEALEAELLIIECTFLGEQKGIDVARAGCHIHIDELVQWAPLIKSQSVLLMHFSQLHKPSEIREICQQKLGPILGDRLHLFLPPREEEQWWI